MNLSVFPRRGYVRTPTPLEPAPKLSELLGGPNIYLKRDDLLPGAGGGNKTRKLDFLMAEALKQKADSVVTCGAVQSNHCRLTAGAAAHEGLECLLVLEERVPDSYKPWASGNNLLFHLLGVSSIRVVPGGSDMDAETAKSADALRAAGKNPYVIPGGASNPLGALGYAACAEELLQQCFFLGLRPDAVVVASGSAGTHAGLLAGFAGCNARVAVHGISVNRPRAAQEDKVCSLAEKTAELAGRSNLIARGDVTVHDDYVGPGYSLPTAGMREAVTLTARTEGVLLDPVYTGKAMAGLIDLVRKGVFRKGQDVVFMHTGGSPALYVYADEFLTAREGGVEKTD
ncbi:MAG: D-cysteine desulfhydrase [Desulfovibrio sp.]|jgi:D-cysteine desulfhydrase|nr:D-cysteine desulfhydrase [Desulfovibrio sp.]